MAQGQEYESLLERDFLKILSFDPAVATVLAQPIKIPYQLDGAPRTYVPDVLVTFHPDSQGLIRLPALYEVKPQEYADDPDHELAAKLAAATLYCATQDWIFKVVTEVDIRTVRLNNVNFLSRYLGRHCHPGHKALLNDRLAQWNGSATVRALMASIYRTPSGQAELLPDIWTFIANQELFADLDAPLNMNTEIWSR